MKASLSILQLLIHVNINAMNVVVAGFERGSSEGTTFGLRLEVGIESDITVIRENHSQHPASRCSMKLSTAPRFQGVAHAFDH